MRLICVNAWGGRLAEPLLAYLGEQAPDILCVQEVTRAPVPHPGPLWFHGGAEPLLQRPDLFEDVRGVLPGHEATFCPAMRGDLFDERGRAVRSEFGIATFVRRDLPVIGQVQGFVHGDFRAGGWGPPPVPRSLHGLRLGPSGARERALRVAHLHGLRDPDGKRDTPARAAQAERIVGLLGALGAADEPLIVCGDLNLLPGSATFERLGRLGLRDLVGSADTRTSHYRKTPRSADYLLVTPDVPVARFEIVAAPEVSDHRPLRLDLRRAARRPAGVSRTRCGPRGRG